MKVTYFMVSPGMTGGNLVIFHHMEALAKEGINVQLITPFGIKNWAAGTLEELFKHSYCPAYNGIWKYAKKVQYVLRNHAPGIERLAMNWYSGSENLISSSSSVTRRLVEQWTPSDITVATHSFTAHAAALVSRKSNVFYHMQGFEPWFSDDPVFQSISELSYRLPLKKFANCTWLQDKVFALTGDKIGLVRPGLNHQVFYPRQSQKINDNKMSGDKKIKIVSYADSRPLKGWAESQLAMKSVFLRMGNDLKVEWEVFGSTNVSSSEVSVRNHGFLSHEKLAMLYSNADIVFVPSWFESFPLQPVEAMACGAAVITTRIGTEDYARHNETALVVEPRKPESLANAIIRLIYDCDKREKLASAGLAEAKKFTWDQSAREVKAALEIC
ncbi:glycosyltransferase family 4 protein [Aidingimonas lacisalsi]|uniref:glycosyltransferase family 4 protein n=1 Tax=Aidingimonas lacisalsi TaxID=2604086 RepID=UPI0011D189DB|nr:glycosyltransferase family 4 protein [Aidingimonas lacisalsi]